MILHKKQQVLELDDLELMNYLRKDMVQECLSEMSVREILLHPVSRKQIKVQLSYNSTEQTIYWLIIKLKQKKESCSYSHREL